jgi:ABC-type transporter Mla MlaB component
MKLKHEVDPHTPGTVRARVAGDLEVASCTCLQNFWELRLAAARELQLDLSDIEEVEDAGLATLAALLQRQLEAGTRVTVRGAAPRLRDGLVELCADDSLLFEP